MRGVYPPSPPFSPGIQWKNRFFSADDFADLRLSIKKCRCLRLRHLFRLMNFSISTAKSTRIANATASSSVKPEVPENVTLRNPSLHDWYSLSLLSPFLPALLVAPSRY
ncbi:MAG: hypothetical protein U5K38_05600 [Woeseiaceae bacterium]|nr:hypothetical protein [Woeseiaceae bacterium]